MSENQANDAHSIALIYEDTHRSISQLTSRIDSLNTRLTLVLGFEATFIKFAADLPDHFDTVMWQTPLLSEGCNLFLGRCNSCLVFKLLTFIALLIAIYFALLGILPMTMNKGFLDPIDQLEDKSINSKQEFQEVVVRLLAKNSIPDLKNILTSKSKNLRNSLLALGAASTASAIDLIISTIFVAP